MILLELIPVDDPAGKLALATVAAAGVWKLILRMRHEHREDRVESRTFDVTGGIAKSYVELIEQLRTEVDRLSADQRELKAALDEERIARYNAERIARDLRGRVETLEARLRDLGHDP